MNIMGSGGFGGGGGYWMTPPVGGFSALTGQADAVNPLVDVSGSGMLEQLGGSFGDDRTRYGVIVEVDGVEVIAGMVVGIGGLVIGNASNGTTNAGSVAPIRFLSTLKVWITSVPSTAGDVVVAGRLM